MTIAIRDSIAMHLAAEYGKLLQDAQPHEVWTALCRSIMERIAPQWEKNRAAYRSGRQAHYFSAEFLVGRSLLNNLINLGIYEEVRDTLTELGYSLEELEEEETDPGLGNGGLGRLAACFLDSCASLDYPVTGYGILYRYGLFKQQIEDGFQKEYPDPWMELPYPFNCRRDEDRCLVRYQDMDVFAVPYDLPVTGYHTKNVNVLRLWKPEAAQQFDFNLFNSQRFDDAVIERNRVDDIYRVLYPNDTSYDGKILRVRQQYFFVSASLQSILKDYIREHGEDFSRLADYNVVQLNDTHPVLAIPELMRLLMDEKGLGWDESWEICRKTFAFTNHTIMSEAMEKWDLGIFQFLFPRILEIVRGIDQSFRKEARSRGMQSHEIEQLTPVHDGKIHMALLACYASFSINGVAAIHSEILKKETLKSFYRLWPERFSNKTNGVTPRRWLRSCNPELASLITEKLGDERWITDLERLEKLEKWQDDPKTLRRFLEIKQRNKDRLATLIENSCGVEIDRQSIFDVQVKRLHEYKRQMLNALAILDQYYRLKEDPALTITPVTYIFGAKAAPGYFRAKSIIKFINEVANLVNHDRHVSQWMRVIFLPNYNVSIAEKIFPAADISEQISTVGKEASGTGNMKFMMNGALTIGTWDGANLEICEAVGEENAYMFGAKLADFPSTLAYYNSQWQYQNIPGLKRVIDTLVDGSFSDGGSGMFRDLYQSLTHGSSTEKADIYYLLGDFNDYRSRRDEAQMDYLDRESWARKCWINIANSGRFSSDRTIREYADGIWKIKGHKI